VSPEAAQIESILRTVAAGLAAIRGVSAVVLGGSRARGEAARDSDVDLGIYYRSGAPLDLDALRALARELDPHGEGPTEPGAWGPWVNGGAWLRVEGLPLDWIYRDLERVARTVEECSAGRPVCDYYLGHPHGFHSHVYLAELHACRPLHDPHGVVRELKARVASYPPALRLALVRRFLYDAEFMLELGTGTAGRGDVFHVSGCLFRTAAALVQVLFALNERWFMNEKGALEAIERCERRPHAFASRTRAILASPGADAGALARSCREAAALVAETRALCAGLLS
jgi:predicted nucleotidyltransferase